MMHSSQVKSMFKKWWQDRYSNPDVIVLLITFFTVSVLIIALSHILMPVLISLVLSYLLDSIIQALQACRFSRLAALLLVYILFLVLIFGGLFILLPLVCQQAWHLLKAFPDMIARGKILLSHLSSQPLSFIPVSFLQENMTIAQQAVTHLGKLLVSYSLTSISNLVQWGIYVVLVPLMVLFFLKDKDIILSYLTPHWPKNRRLVTQVLEEINHQMGCYIRGRLFEMLIVGISMAIICSLWHVSYVLLLSSLVGLSVLIPFIGTAIVSLLVIIMAFLQWGMEQHFASFMLAYTILIIIDSHVLAPLLFAETMKIHPVVIIIALLLFGALWGFWGIFFAIPLATAVKAIFQVCFRQKVLEVSEE